LRSVVILLLGWLLLVVVRSASRLFWLLLDSSIARSAAFSLLQFVLDIQILPARGRLSLNLSGLQSLTFGILLGGL